eukprot:9321459-Pyramimonas_sp.AAC.1
MSRRITLGTVAARPSRSGCLVGVRGWQTKLDRAPRFRPQQNISWKMSSKWQTIGEVVPNPRTLAHAPTSPRTATGGYPP